MSYFFFFYLKIVILSAEIHVKQFIKKSRTENIRPGLVKSRSKVNKEARTYDIHVFLNCGKVSHVNADCQSTRNYQRTQ